jgi:hypothetical protein
MSTSSAWLDTLLERWATATVGGAVDRSQATRRSRPEERLRVAMVLRAAGATASSR